MSLLTTIIGIMFLIVFVAFMSLLFYGFWHLDDDVRKKNKDDDHLRIIITYRPDDFKSDSEKPADSGKSD